MICVYHCVAPRTDFPRLGPLADLHETLTTNDGATWVVVARDIDLSAGRAEMRVIEVPQPTPEQLAAADSAWVASLLGIHLAFPETPSRAALNRYSRRAHDWNAAMTQHLLAAEAFGKVIVGSDDL